MALLTVQVLDVAGIQPTYAAVGIGGDTFANNGRVFAHVKNASAGSVDVTVDSAHNCNQGFDHNIVVNIPAGEERMIGPLPTQRFNNASGQVSLSYSAITSVTIGVFQVP